MSDETLPDWVRKLDLQPHPEGGWFRETWRSTTTIPQSALPAGYPGDRAAGTAIYFVLMPGQQSAWHTVRSSEIWLYHRGAPVRLDLGGDGDVPGEPEPILVGPDTDAGQQPQAWSRPGCGSAPRLSATSLRSSAASWCPARSGTGPPRATL